MFSPSSRPIINNSVVVMATATLHQIPSRPFPRLAAFLEATIIMNMIMAMMNKG
ncbi:hypothetical protein D3C77_349830 [compost metagenome]